MVTNNAANIPTAAASKVAQGQGVGVAIDFSTATYPSTATGTGKILRADGTNWAASTATYPDTAGTSGNVLTSDGTNWVSSAPPASSGIVTISGSLTNAQIKALHATPIQILAAQGAGTVISIISAVGKMVYGGTNVFTAAAAQSVALYWGPGTTQVFVTAPVTNAMLVASASQISSITPTLAASTTVYTNVSNVALYFYNNSATEIGGNAANDNTITYNITYKVITI